MFLKMWSKDTPPTLHAHYIITSWCSYFKMQIMRPSFLSSTLKGNTCAYGNGSQSLFSFWHGWLQTVGSKEEGWTKESSLSSVLKEAWQASAPRGGRGGSCGTNRPGWVSEKKRGKAGQEVGLSLAGLANAEQSSQTRPSLGHSLWVLTKSRAWEWGLGFQLK